MQPINILLTLTSLNVILVTIERFSFTTGIVLQPYNYLRLHELLQMSTLMLFSILLPLFLLRELTHNFETLRTRKGMAYLVLFITGIYFYATGNGLHEVASFLFNHYCNTTHFTDALCGSLFVNDYFTGNILFFIGGYCMNLALLFFERIKPVVTFSRNDMIVLIANSLLYALAILAYAAFDRVVVGAAFSIVTTVTVIALFVTSKRKKTTTPFTLYCVISYTLATVGSIIVRLLMSV